MEEYILSDGFKIPKVGFGTFTFKGNDGVRRIEMALKNGFRLLDSAYNYENEAPLDAPLKIAPSPVTTLQ